MSQTLPFMAMYTKASGGYLLAAAGLTVTVNIYAIALSDGGVVQIATDVVCAEIADGGYFHIINGANLTSFFYFSRFHTADATVQAKDIGAGRFDLAATITKDFDGALSLTTEERDNVATVLLDLEDGVETGRTLRQTLRLMLAALAGKLSGAATSEVLIRDTNDMKDRIVATVDANGNRTAVTLDAT